jgi:N-acetylmuramoyl-L-alanine amidase
MRTGVRWLVFGLLFSLCTTAMAQRATLRDARFWTSKDKTRVVFDLSGNTHPELFMLNHPLRLVIDLPDTRKASTVASKQAGSGVVERIRTGIRHSTGVRVVLDLAAMIQPKSFMLDPKGHHGYRLVVDLYPQGGAPKTRIAAEDSSGHASDEGAKIAQKTAAALAQASPSPAAKPSGIENQDSDARQTPVGYTPQRPNKNIVIAIDAGHGGRDSGAIGPGDVEEKNITLEIARRLQKMVDEQPHMHGVLTRKGDYYVGLRQRMVTARQDKADFFISIHCDAAPHHGSGASGASVYALSRHGATSEHAHWLARRENAVDLVNGISLKNKDKSLASFMLDLSQSASIEASLDAGTRVLTALDGFSPLHRDKVQQAAFVVLKSPGIPSILVETNYITNPHTEHKLESASYQKKLAEAMLTGIKGYFSSYRPATYIAKGQEHKVKRGETLSGIAQEYGVSVPALRQYNHLDSDMIQVGTKLKIPPPGHQQLAGLQ